MANKISPDAPALTVVLTSAGNHLTLRRTLAAIASQTIAHRIEVLIVSPDDSFETTQRDLLERFHSFRVFTQKVDNVDFAAGKTMRKAKAPIVASIEDHAYPEPEWAEVILETFDDDCVAVGSAFIPANPGSRFGWLNALIAFTPWHEAAPEGETDWVCLHNCTYRRAALDSFDDDMYLKFNRGGEILHDLKASGATFRFSPRARVRHLNVSSLKSTALLRFDAGRLYAATRAESENWHFAKRLTYTILSPAIPLVRYLRLRKELLQGRPGVSERKLGGVLFLGLIFDGAGQAAGFLLGPGGSTARLVVHEMNRFHHLNERDLRTFAPPDYMTA